MSASTTPLSILEEKFPHHHHAVSGDQGPEPRDGDEIRKGMTRVAAGTLNKEAAEGLISLREPNGGSCMHRLLEEDCEPAKPLDRLVQDAEQAPTTEGYTTPSSRTLGSWADEIASEWTRG